MIFGNIQQLEAYSFLKESVLSCFAYAREHALAEYETGVHEIDGKRLFVNISQYETTLPENRFWEAHRVYLDLHLVLSGTEQIDLNFIQNMEQKEYKEENDLLLLSGSKNSSVIMRSGDFLICDPYDAHCTAIQVNSPETVKKAIFKIKL